MPAGAPSALDGRLLGGEARGVGRGPVGPGVAEASFPLGEASAQEALGRPGAGAVTHEPADALDLDHVDPQSQDHGAPRQSSSFISRTARSMPTSSARATMAWPMLSSSISRMASTGSTFW